VLLALWEVRLLKSVVPIPVPPWVTVQVSGRSLVFTIALALLTGVAAGIVPALRLARGMCASRWRPAYAGRVRRGGAGRSADWSSRRSRCRSCSSPAQGLLLTSLARLEAVPPGFSPDGVLIARLTLAGHGINRATRWCGSTTTC
jgi:hypothetical protein